MILHLVDQVDSLDAKHESFVSDQLFQLGFNDPIKPCPVKATRRLQLNNGVCWLLSNHKHGIYHHTNHGRLNLGAKGLLFDKFCKFREKLDSGEANTPSLVLGQIDQSWDQLLMHGSHWQYSDERFKIFNQRDNDFCAVVFKQDWNHGNKMRTSLLWWDSLSQLTDGERHATLDMLAAFRGQLQFETGQHRLDYQTCGTVGGQIWQFVDRLRANLRLTITQQSYIEG